MPLDIFLDTDIGDDIDDALALALILRSPELNLCGVTTVFQDAPKRAALARHVLQTFGQGDVPVVAGCSRPLLESCEMKVGSQIGILPDATWNETDHAVDFLLEAARNNETLTIVPIGPLTNIALLLARAPELAPRLRIVMMGGCANESEIEWNIRCDPEAAAIVFQSQAQISLVGLDVTRQVMLNEEQVTQISLKTTPENQLILQLIRLWQGNGAQRLFLHDPLAVLALFDNCLTWQVQRLEVELCGEQRGMTRVVAGEPNMRVAVEVNAPRALETFLSRMTQ